LKRKLLDLGNTDLRKVNSLDFKEGDAFRKNRKEKRDKIRTESIFQGKINVSISSIVISILINENG